MLEWDAEHVEGNVEGVVTGNCVPLLKCTVNTLEVSRLNSYSSKVSHSRCVLKKLI